MCPKTINFHLYTNAYGTNSRKMINSTAKVIIKDSQTYSDQVQIKTIETRGFASLAFVSSFMFSKHLTKCSHLDRKNILFCGIL
jgi:hypothetical protein